MYDGEYVDGVRCGQGKMTYPDGSEYNGTAIANKGSSINYVTRNIFLTGREGSEFQKLRVT